MPDIETSAEAGAASFPSFSALRDAHGALHTKRPAETQQAAFSFEVETFIRQARATGRLLNSRDERTAAQGLIAYWASVLDRAGGTLPELDLAEFDESYLPELKDESCPYVGLDAFDEEHGRLFFGRRSKLGDLIDRLKTRRLLPIVGPSGSGKSSIVSAGLIPLLKSGRLEESEHWQYYRPVAPGSTPLSNMARMYCPEGAWQAFEAANDVKGLAAEIVKAASTLGKPGVFVIDQFEEIFSLCQDESMRAAVGEILTSLVEDPAQRHIVILTLRNDFEEFLPRLGDFYELFREGRFDLLPMSARELRETIEQPAAAAGLHFEEGVVDALIDDLLGEPAGLPLLQFTLLKLWDKRRRNRVTMQAYVELGGGRLALERSADAFYNSLLVQDQERARHILLRMVALGKSMEVTSKRLQRKTLYRVEGDQARLDPVLNRMIQARLIRLSPGGTPGDDQIEVAHEALVRNWGRLNEWLAAERERLQRRSRLTALAEEWDRLQREPAALVRGVVLEEAERYDDLSELESKFVEASREQDAFEKAHLRSLVDKAEKQRLIAERQARIATSQRLAAQSSITAYSHRRLLLALASLATTARNGEPRLPAAEEALREALADVRGRSLGVGHRAAVSDIAVTRDCRWILTAGADQTVRAWDMTAADPALAGFSISCAPASAVRLAITPAGDRLVAACNDRAVRVWEMGSGRAAGAPAILGPLELPIRAMAVSSNGKWLAVGTESNTVHLWDLGDLRQTSLEGHRWGIRSLVFSPDSNLLASGGDDHTVRLWSMDGPQGESRELRDATNAIWALAFTPDNKRLIAGGVDATVRLWDVLDRWAPPLNLGRLNASIVSLAVSPDGNWLAAAVADQTVRVWDLTQLERPPEMLSGHEDWISVLRISEDSRWVLTGSADKTVRVWSLGGTASQPIVLRGHERCVRSAAISPDSQWLATCADDGAVQFLDLRNPAPPYPHVFERGRVPSALSQDGRWLAAVDAGHGIALYDLGAAGRQLAMLELGSLVVREVAISPDSRWVVAATNSNEPRVWDLRSRNPGEIALRGHSWGVRCVAFLPDGSRIVTGSDDYTICIWKTTELLSEPVRIVGHASVYAIAVSPDGRWLAAGDWSGYVSLWNAIGGEFVYRTTSHVATHRIWLLKFSPDSRWLIAGGHQESRLSAFDLSSPDEPCIEFEGHSEWVTSAVFTPDSQQLITAGEDSLIALRDTENLRVARDYLRGHEWGVRGLCLQPGGDVLASCSDDKTVRLWDLRKRSESPVVFRGHNTPVTSVHFTPDGEWLISASPYSATRMWDLRVGRLERLACAIAGRNFNAGEWKQYFPDEEYSVICPNAPVPVDVIEEELRKTRELSGESGAEARNRFTRLAAWAARTNDSRLLMEVGRQGCISGVADSVVSACERAVAMEPQNYEYRALLAVARALSGDSARGLGELREVIGLIRDDGRIDQARTYQRWLDEVQAGRNPLTSTPG